MSTVRTYDDPAALADAAAHYFVKTAQAAIEERGRFAVALAGGSTPKAMLVRLAQPDLIKQLDWLVTHIFWGDERAVPPDHMDSNYRMAREALLDHTPLPAANINRIHGELEPATAATNYEDILRTYFALSPAQKADAQPRFDLVFLGMGDDGHTASLFPGAEAIQEQQQWVSAYHVDKLASWRMTLTPVVLNAAARVVFLVTGEGKANRLRQVLYGPYQPHILPAQIISPKDGRLLWFIDEAAAGSL